MRACRVLLVLVCFSLLPSFAAGQTVNVTTGAINGRITDSSGGVLPGAIVTAVNTATALTRTVAADGEGQYLIALLPPGRYRVDAEMTGLGKASVPDVEVLLGNATRADIKISPQFTQAITVTGTSPTVDTTRSGIAVSVTSNQIEDLPILGRDFRSLAVLTPGIVDAFGGRITANGARGIATDYNIDGASSNNDFFGENTGGTRAPFTFSQAAIREFQVVRSQYDAEYGRGVGAQINAITKSGTNAFSGEAFLFRRNRGWAATRPRTLSNGQVVVDSFRAKTSTQPGFAVGGPLVKDKVFFFGNFDAQRQKLPITITNDVRASNGYLALSAPARQQFLSKLEDFLGHPYDQELRYDQTFDQNTYLGKIDANIGNTHRLSVRDNFTDFENGNNQSLGHLSNQGTEHDKFNQLVGQLSSTLGNRLVNQVLVEFSRDERPVDPVSQGAEVQISGLTSSSFFFGQNDFLPNNTVEKKVQVKDSLQFIQGRHSVKVGTDLLFMDIDNLFPRNRNGVFVYNTPTAFINGSPNTFRQGSGPGGGLTTWHQNTYAFFVTDNVRTGRLTLDLGLRYDWQTVPLPADNAFPQHPEFITQINEDKNNVAPRLGFAYDIFGDGNSVVRGGTGLFYGYMPDILLSNPLTQISGNFNQVSIACNASNLTVRCPAFPGLLTADQFAQLARVSSDIVTVGSDYEAQQSWRSSLQVEKRIGHGYTAGISAVYSKMSNVQGSRNINATPTGVVLGNLPVYELLSSSRRYTDMGVVRELCSCETASYKALTLETHRLAVGRSRLSWDLSYTLGKSIDQDTNERSTSSSFLFDPSNPALSEGPGDNDVRHRIVGDATYRLPYGFMASTIVQWRTGVPYNPGIAFTGSGIPGSPNSLNGLSAMTGNIPLFVNSSGAVIDLLQANGFTRAQFADWLAGQGARIIGRNANRQPRWHTIDLRISKTFDVGHDVRVQVLGEIFNLQNAQNRLVGSTNQNRYRATFTQSTGKYTFTEFSTFGLENSYAFSPDPRQYQVAAKIMF